MEYPYKVGISMPDELKDRYETEPHEYLVASRCEYLTGSIHSVEYGDHDGGTPTKKIIYAHADIVGYVDLTANITKRRKEWMWMQFTAYYPCPPLSLGTYEGGIRCAK